MADPKLYKITAAPQLATVTPGAVVSYDCSQTYATISAADGPRDTCQWFCYNDHEAAKERGGPYVLRGPSGFLWKEAKWSFLGRHEIQCNVRFTDGQTVCYNYPQWVEGLELFLAKELFKARKGGLADPVAAFSGVDRYIKVLKDIEAQIPISDSEKKKEHDQALKQYQEYRDKLAERLASTQYSLRIPINAVHLETASQRKSKLNIFIACVERNSEGQTWHLVDWTNPVDRTHTGEYSGTGPTAEAAIRDAITSWDSGNRYYDGKLTWEISPKVCGKAMSSSFDTDGASTWDSVSSFFEWVALGGAVVAGVVTLIAPVPGSQIVSAAIWTSIFSSTAAAAINIGQRHEEGFGSWKDDAFDGLTIVGNLFAGAGMWAKGTSVVARNAEGKVVKYVLIGQIGTDSVQGVLIAADHMAKYDEIMNDKSLAPDERAKKLLELFRSLTVAGVMTYISLKGTKADLDNLNKTPKHLTAPEERKSPAQKIEELKDTKNTIDVTQPPKVEGHTQEGKQVTKVNDKQVRPSGHGEPPIRPKVFPDPPPPPKRGLRKKDDRAFRGMARRKNLIILVRDANPDSVEYIGKNGYKPKPENVKGKTRKTSPNVGLASADPTDKRFLELLAAEPPPMQLDDLLNNAAEQKSRYEHFVDVKIKKKGYEVGPPEEGYLVQNAKTKDKFYSDYDLHGVYDASGKNAYSEQLRSEMNQKLGHEQVQHGPHDLWPERNDVSAGPNRGPQGEAGVTAFLPDGSTQYFSSNAEMKQFYNEHGIHWDEIYPVN